MRPQNEHLPGEESGSDYVGVHLLIDMWGAIRIDDPDFVTDIVHEAIHACRASLLHFELRRFEPQGLTAFALLRESHIAFHSWPERDYAAVDIFTCGNLDVYSAADVLRIGLSPRDALVIEHSRGSAASRSSRAVSTYLRPKGVV